MRFRELQAANITAIFSVQFDHRLISTDKIASLFITGDTQKDVKNVVEAPGLKIIGFPNQQKAIAFEPNRLIVSNNKIITESVLIDDFMKVFSLATIIDKSKLVAHGFNIVGLAEAESEMALDIISQKLLQFSSAVKQEMAGISFEKNGVKYVLQLKPVQEKVYNIHLNAHYQSSSIPSVQTLNRELSEQLVGFQDMIKKI